MNIPRLSQELSLFSDFMLVPVSLLSKHFFKPNTDHICDISNAVVTTKYPFWVPEAHARLVPYSLGGCTCRAGLGCRVHACLKGVTVSRLHSLISAQP